MKHTCHGELDFVFWKAGWGKIVHAVTGKNSQSERMDAEICDVCCKLAKERNVMIR